LECAEGGLGCGLGREIARDGDVHYRARCYVWGKEDGWELDLGKTGQPSDMVMRTKG
jgi:hypothetical protein